MKYLFILGRNPELSIAEIVAVFGNKKFIKNGNAILLEIEKLEEGIIKRFGGVYAIGEVLCNVNELDKKNIYLKTKNNISYVLWDFSSKTEEVRDYLKKRFKKERLKATEKRLNFMVLQSGETAGVSHGLIDEEYFVFDDYFGKIIQKTSFKEIEKRDMKKPIIRQELAISPRLAKIMIGLSNVKQGGILLDPFCGIGVILQEALIQGINVIGIDKDKEAVKGCRENLKFLNPSKKYKLFNEDSKKVKIKERVDVIVTEPYLGEILRKVPTEEKAREILKEFEALVISVLNNLKGNVKGKIVLTAPIIQIFKKDKRISCNAERIQKATGLKFLQKPIQEFREGQIVGREIFVMGK